MSNLAHITPRTAALGKSYATWALDEFTANGSARKDLPAISLVQAVAMATPPVVAASLVPKGGFDAFVILETDERESEGKARSILHVFTVKVKREWRAIGEFGTTAQAAVPYAVHAGSLAMDSFEPRRPFRAGTDSAANGLQPGEGRLIEISTGVER